MRLALAQHLHAPVTPLVRVLAHEDGYMLVPARFGPRERIAPEGVTDVDRRVNAQQQLDHLHMAGHRRQDDRGPSVAIDQADACATAQQDPSGVDVALNGGEHECSDANNVGHELQVLVVPLTELVAAVPELSVADAPSSRARFENDFVYALVHVMRKGFAHHDQWESIADGLHAAALCCVWSSAVDWTAPCRTLLCVRAFGVRFVGTLTFRASFPQSATNQPSYYTVPPLAHPPSLRPAPPLPV